MGDASIVADQALASRTGAIDWGAALAEHSRWLRTVLYARLRDAAAVDDVMQEIALAAVRQSAPLRDGAKLAPWLYRLAVRQALLYRRGCGRQRKLLERVVAAAPAQASEGADPLVWLLADERRELVRAALARLPRRDAEILLLKYTENWSYRQIAGHLGASEATVESRLFRARARLRAALGSLTDDHRT
jgi:RNA polymerase sigma-70 factor (ECF subfamily)